LLSELNKNGLISLDGKRITILDRKALNRLSGD